MNIVKMPGDEFVTFYADIEAHVSSANVSYMDAIITWAERRNIEIEYIASLIDANPNMRAKIQIEGEQLNFLKKTKRLPI